MTDGFTYPTGRGPQAEDDPRLHQLPRDQRYSLAQEVIRLAGEHARNDIGTVMLWPSASVVLLSSIDWRRPTSLAPAVARTTLGPTPQSPLHHFYRHDRAGVLDAPRPVARSSYVEEATRGQGVRFAAAATLRE
jgi:hypothetical protein